MKQITRLVTLFFVITSNSVFAHGYLSTQFFPATISIDETFITDKVALTTYRTEAAGNIWTTNPKLAYSKTITKNLEIYATASYLHIQKPGERNQNGFNDWFVGMRYNVFTHDATESMLSVALNATLGGTGNSNVNASSHTSLAPELLFAKGFNHVYNIKYLRPLAFTIAISPEFVTSNYNVTSVNAGVALEYSFPYMQQYIAHFNFSLLDYLVPVIEFPFVICTKNCKARSTGTIDPGIILYNKYGQIGMEAIIPANRNTGNKVGGVLQLYLYLDTIFPNTLGKPLWCQTRETFSQIVPRV